MALHLVIVGAGGLGSEALWSAFEMNRAAEAAGAACWCIAGFADDDAAKAGVLFCGFPVFGSLVETAAQLQGEDVQYFCAVGNNQLRQQLVQVAEGLGWRAATIVHPTAIVAGSAILGDGSYVAAGACICPNARLGAHVIVNVHASVGHDVVMGDFSQACPGVRISGNCTIEEQVFLGSNASVAPKVKVGKAAKVAAGSAVIRHIKAGVSVIGVPAQPMACPAAPAALPTVSHSVPAQKRILLSVPHMSGLEKPYVDEAFASNWLSTVGPNITAFEREFGEKFATNALAVGSGTAAIHLGLRAMGVGSGDYVFCSDFTFVASANPILYQGAIPVFIDSEPATWNMDPRLLAQALGDADRANRLPKAVVVVHLFGQCADMDPILECCAQYGVPALEDAAEAIGATYKGRPAGTMGEVGAFSFNGNKMITTTGGGMLVAKNAELIKKAQFWATQAREPGPAYEHIEAGYNYRLSNVLAGIGRGQLQVLDERVGQRRAIALTYAKALAHVNGLCWMPQAEFGLHANWLTCVLVDEEAAGCTRDELIAKLDADGIETRPLWKPMHLQPLYKSARCYGGAVGETLFRQGICLPSSSSLSKTEQQYVIERIEMSVAGGSSDKVDEKVEKPLLIQH